MNFHTVVPRSVPVLCACLLFHRCHLPLCVPYYHCALPLWTDMETVLPVYALLGKEFNYRCFLDSQVRSQTLPFPRTIIGVPLWMEEDCR